MAKIELANCLHKFTAVLNQPNCLLVSKQDKVENDICEMLEHYKWLFTVLNPDDEELPVPNIPKIIRLSKLIIVDSQLEFNAGLICGMAFGTTPVILYSKSKETHSKVVKLIDGICYSHDDLLLFMDAYMDRHYMSEIRTRINGAMTVLRNLRLGV